MVAFYSPIQSVPQSQPAPESKENYSASLGALPASSTAPDSNSVNQVSTSSASDKASFKDMSGFSDLNQESDLLKEMGTGGATSTVDNLLTN